MQPDFFWIVLSYYRFLFFLVSLIGSLLFIFSFFSFLFTFGPLFLPSLSSPSSPFLPCLSLLPYPLSSAMGEVGRAFRPIAPRTMPPGGGAGGQPPLGSSGGGPTEDGRMKRASTACKECQKRRTRVMTTIIQFNSPISLNLGSLFPNLDFTPPCSASRAPTPS